MIEPRVDRNTKEEIATRLIAGEQIEALSKEYGLPYHMVYNFKNRRWYMELQTKLRMEALEKENEALKKTIKERSFD